MSVTDRESNCGPSGLARARSEVRKSVRFEFAVEPRRIGFASGGVRARVVSADGRNERGSTGSQRITVRPRAKTTFRSPPAGGQGPSIRIPREEARDDDAAPRRPTLGPLLRRDLSAPVSLLRHRPGAGDHVLAVIAASPLPVRRGDPAGQRRWTANMIAAGEPPSGVVFQERPHMKQADHSSR
ncbi:trypco2 family protein [Streptomyces sp. NPDC002788]